MDYLCFNFQVMGGGRVLEYGVPYKLLKNPDGFLVEMINHTAPDTQKKLQQIAREAYNNNAKKDS